MEYSTCIMAFAHQAPRLLMAYPGGLPGPVWCAILAPALFAAALPAAASSYIHTDSASLQLDAPEGLPGAAALQCDGTALVYGLNLTVRGGDGNYTIYADSMRVGERALRHPQVSGNPLGASLPGNLGANHTLPLAMYGGGPLHIPLSYGGAAAGASLEVDVSYAGAAGCRLSGGLEGAQTVGLILPLSGGDAEAGAELLAAHQLALADFNWYLRAERHDWSLDFAVADGTGGAAASLDAAAQMRGGGIGLLLGPAGDGPLAAVSEYAAQNNMTLISCCSAAPGLAADDRLFRMMPPPAGQAGALSALMVRDGVETLVPVYRDDAYGRAVSDAVGGAFAGRGGHIAGPIIYPANGTTDDYYDAADRLEDTLGQTGTGRAAVLLVSYGEADDILRIAGDAGPLLGVNWYASDSVLGYDMGDEALNVAAAVNLTGAAVSPLNNTAYHDVAPRLANLLGKEPGVYSYASYDAVWLLGRAMLYAQSASYDDVAGEARRAGLNNYGAMGLSVLDRNGDLESANYQFWRLADRSWTAWGSYEPHADIIR